jgi:hypothetical protein
MVGLMGIFEAIIGAGEEGKKSGIAKLMGQAYNAAPDQRQGIMSEIARRDGPSAFAADKQFGEQDKAKYDDLGQEANMFVALAQSGDEATTSQAYQRLAQKAQAAGHPVPPQYDPRMLPMIEKLASTAGGTASGSMVQSTFVDAQGNRMGILRDGRTVNLGQNAPNNQILDTGNGFVGVNKGNLTAAPVMLGGQPQPQQPPSGATMLADGSQANIDPDLPPNIRADIAANPTKYMGGGDVQGPPMVQGAGPQQLRSAPKPQAPSALQEKIATARAMGATPDQLKQMVVGGGGGDAEITDLSPAAIDNAATRYNITGTLPPLGMGAAAAGLRKEILTRAAVLAGGQTATDLAMQPADYKNSQVTLKGLQVSSAAMSRATDTLHSNASLLLAASQKALGGSFTGTRLENEARLAYGRQTNDPAVAEFDQYAQTVANEYAKIIGGAPGSNAAATEGARADAERAIHKASSPAALKATIDSLYKEAANIRAANDKEMARLRSTLSGQQQAPAQGGSQRIRYDAQGNRIQ